MNATEPSSRTGAVSRPLGGDYDAVVVGARVAGAATAMLLARHGMRVLVVDRAREGSDTLSTHALMRAGIVQLHRWGLLDRIRQAGTPPLRRTTFTYGSEQVVITVKPSHGVDALYAPRRTVLDPVIVDAAASAGAEVRYGVTVDDVLRDTSGRVRGIVGRDARGGPFSVTAPLVIGADGIRSTIATKVDAAFERIGSGVTAVVYGYWTGIGSDGYEWMFDTKGAAGVIPTNGGAACVFASAPPERIGRGGLRVMRSVLAAAAPDLAARVDAAGPPVGVRSFGGRVGYVRRSWGPGWALVGDAGYFKDPISAHGITDALRDAELLARAVVGSGVADRDDALADYQAQRDRISADLFDTVDAIAANRWSMDEIPGLLLRLSSAMSLEVETLAALDAPGPIGVGVV
jgi:2-polyprenyl-6-methoxyphenol hydroxylase-like FAD-dependent oxidoreductase